jgi:hypothetical protein
VCFRIIATLFVISTRTSLLTCPAPVLFQELSDKKAPECLEMQDEAQLAALVDHADYALQVRTDQLGDAVLADDAKTYRCVG